MTRRRLGRALLVVALALGTLLLSPGPALACSCATESVAMQVRQAESVAVGTVAWQQEGSRTSTIAVDFRQVYKGSLGSREKVLTSARESACGLGSLVSGKRYVFFVHGTHRGRISASACGGTTPYAAAVVAQVEKVTGPPHDPVEVDASVLPEPSGRHWWWLGAGGGVLLLAAGSAWWSQRPRRRVRA